MSVVEVPYTALRIHEGFHRDTAPERHMFGAFGSGKTYAICAEAIKWCIEQPGITGIITRRTIPELRDSTEKVFFNILPRELLAAGTLRRAGGHVESFQFSNGSLVMFRAIDDWMKYKSYNLGFIAWDEMDEFDEETYDGMMSRIRQRDPEPKAVEQGAAPIRYRGTWGASNPAGHNWIWRRWVDKPERGKHVYFKSTSFDNPFLTPDYFDRLLSYPLPWIKRYVLCQFDDFGGQIYEGWNETDHVIAPFPINRATGEPLYPAHSTFFMGMDPGTRDPTAGLWVVAVRQPVVRLIAVAEYQENSLSADVHARAFRQAEARHRLRPIRRIADPQTINVRDRGSNNKLSDIYRRLGFTFELGPSRFDDRIPALGTLIEKRQFVVTENCRQTFESIRDAKWKDLTPQQRASGEDAPNVPLKRNRHLCDCAEYVGGRWVRPVATANKFRDGRPDWMAEVQKSIQDKIAKSAQRTARMHHGIAV